MSFAVITSLRERTNVPRLCALTQILDCSDVAMGTNRRSFCQVTPRRRAVGHSERRASAVSGVPAMRPNSVAVPQITTVPTTTNTIVAHGIDESGMMPR